MEFCLQAESVVYATFRLQAELQTMARLFQLSCYREFPLRRAARYAPFCFTANDCPAIVMTPLRTLDEVLASRWTLSVPEPKPLGDEVMVIQFAVLFAVQRHPAAVVMLMVPLPPFWATDSETGVKLMAQPLCDVPA